MTNGWNTAVLRKAPGSRAATENREHQLGQLDNSRPSRVHGGQRLLQERPAFWYSAFFLFSRLTKKKEAKRHRHEVQLPLSTEYLYSGTDFFSADLP